MKMFMISLTFSLILSTILSLVGMVLGKKMFFDRELQSPFECGFSTLKESRMPFSLHFFILGLIFVIFDVELIILFPYILYSGLYLSVGAILFYIMFLFLLSLGLGHEWNQNMLEWSK